MQSSKILVLMIVCVMCLAVAATASNNKFGVADVHRVSFIDNIRVGDTLLLAGDYEVRHVMEGDNHIMVFQKLGSRKPLEARVKCELVPLNQKASQTQKSYVTNAQKEQVLRELVFAGETAKHVF
jgi:hypothetical protein